MWTAGYDQGRFKKGMTVNQMYVLKMTIEKHLGGKRRIGSCLLFYLTITSLQCNL